MPITHDNVDSQAPRRNYTRTVAFSSDGGLLAAGSEDKLIRVRAPPLSFVTTVQKAPCRFGTLAPPSCYTPFQVITGRFTPSNLLQIAAPCSLRQVTGPFSSGTFPRFLA